MRDLSGDASAETVLDLAVGKDGDLIVRQSTRRDDATLKMSPPLQSVEDREALLAAVADGTLCTLATDHAPHPLEEGTPARAEKVALRSLMTLE